MTLAHFVFHFLLVCTLVSSFKPLAPRSFKSGLVRSKQQLNMAFDFPLIPAVVLTTAGVFARKSNC